VTVLDAAAGAMKRKGKIGAPRRPNKAGPVNSSHAGETGPKEANAAGSVLRGSEAKLRPKPRGVLRMANAPRGLSVPNEENVRIEVLGLSGASESNAVSGLNALNVRSEASALSEPTQKLARRKVAVKAGDDGGVVDAIVADRIVDQIAADQIVVRARDSHGRNRLDSPRQNRRKISAM
jgi:hypothetical protein